MCPMSSTSTRSIKNEAIKMLSEGIKPIETAKALNLHRSTITKWNRDPEFVAAIEKRRSSQISEIRERLLDIFKNSLPNLELALEDPKGKSFGKALEIVSRSIGLLDKQLDVTNCYRYKSHVDRDRFLELHEEMERIYDRLSPDDKDFILAKIKSKGD